MYYDLLRFNLCCSDLLTPMAENVAREKALGLTGTAVHPENATQEKALGLTGTAVHPENVTQEKALGLTGTGRPSILKKHWGL